MSSTPLEPFWKFVLNEDSDNDEPVERRRKKISKGRSSKYDDNVANSNRKVRFQLPRSKSYGDDEDDDDDVSMLELASMDLTPLVDPEPEGRRFLCKKKDKRDDDDIWNLLPKSSKEDDNASQRNARRKSKENREDPAKDNDFLSLIGLSGSHAHEAKRDQGTGSSKVTDDKRKDLKKGGTPEATTNDSFLSMIGLAETKPGNTLPNSTRNGSASGQSKQNGQNRAKQQQGKAIPTSTDKKPKAQTGRKQSKFVASSSSNRDGQHTSSNKSAPNISEKASFLSRRKKAPIFPDDNQDHFDGAKNKRLNSSIAQETSVRSTEKLSFRQRSNKKPIFPEEKASSGSMLGFLPTTFLSDSTPAPEKKSNRQSSKRNSSKPVVENSKTNLTTRDGKAETSGDVRNRRMQRLKKETQTPPKSSNSPSSASLPVTAVLAAAGVAAIGIAAAGVTATSELFETSPEREQTSYTSQLYEEPKSTSRFWDVFSPSDDESDGSYERGESTVNYSDVGNGNRSRGSLESGETTATYGNVITQYHLREDHEENDFLVENPYDDQLVSRKNMSKSNENNNHSDEPVVALQKDRSLSHDVDCHLETKISKSGDDSVDEVTARESIYHADVDEFEDVIESQSAPNYPASPNQPASPRGIGRMACRSVKDVEAQGDCFYFEDSNLSESENPRYVQHDLSLFPALNTVPDISTKSAVVASENASEQVPFSSEETAEYNNGPRSFYTYDCDATNYTSVCYARYGSPNEIFELNEAPASLRMIDNKGGVIVKIEASTVSYSDCRIRSGDWWGETELDLPLIPGVDFIGSIESIDKRTASRFGFSIGDRVTALVKHGGNARYTKIGAEQLVKVPDDVNPLEAVCLAEAYLSAFQVIHSGQRQHTRYKKTALTGKSILILGVLTNVGRAVVELAKAAGATLVYAPCKDKHRDKVRSIGATPLGVKKEEYVALIHGKLDLIIDATAEIKGDIENYFNALNEKGEYILVGRTPAAVENALSTWWAEAAKNNFVCTSISKSRMMNQVHSYDVYEKWESNLDGCKRDMAHLLKLLKMRHIRPRVLDCVPLYKIAQSQEILEEKRVQGFLICEPWIKSMSRAVYL